MFTCLPRQGPRESLLRPQAASASAPIVLRQNKKKDDVPMVAAMKKAKELRKQKAMEEYDRFNAKCNNLEVSEGKKARAEYEKQYNAEQEAKAAQKAGEVEELKRDLLDAGQDPNTDPDAERKTWLLEHGLDLEEISGTPQNERMLQAFLKRGRLPRMRRSSTLSNVRWRT